MAVIKGRYGYHVEIDVLGVTLYLSCYRSKRDAQNIYNAAKSYLDKYGPQPMIGMHNFRPNMGERRYWPRMLGVPVE